jgi:hypothetical protein
MRPFVWLRHLWRTSADDQDPPVIPACTLALMMIYSVLVGLADSWVMRIVSPC